MKISKIIIVGKQTIRLLKKYWLKGKTISISKNVDKIGWRALLNSLHEFSDDFMDKREQPKIEKRELNRI